MALLESISDGRFLSLSQGSSGLRKLGELPLKLCYGGSGVGRWCRVRADISYDLGQRESHALCGALTRIRTMLPSGCQIVHIGAGAGREAEFVAENLLSSSKQEYLLADISPGMIRSSMHAVRKRRSNASLGGAVIDLETPGWSKALATHRTGAPVALLLLANGALLSSSWPWRELSRALKPGDLCVMLLETPSLLSHHEVTRSYETPSVKALLEVGLRRRGLRLRDGEYFVRYSPESNTLEANFLLNSQACRSESNRAAGYLTLLRSYKPASAHALKARAEKFGLLARELGVDSAQSISWGAFEVRS